MIFLKENIDIIRIKSINYPKKIDFIYINKLFNMNTRFPLKEEIENKNQKNTKNIKKRRKHINFKIQIKSKDDIITYIKFLEKDIKKRKIIDNKYKNDINECHLKHLNFITMEVILLEILKLYLDNYNFKSENEENISQKILYTPEDNYEKDLTSIEHQSIKDKYTFLVDKEHIQSIAEEIFMKYKGFGFINLNFLKRKIYQYV